MLISFCCASTVHMHAHPHEEHPTASRRLQEHWRNLTDPFRGCKLPVNMKNKSWKGGFCISGELSGLAKIGHDIVLRIIMCDGWNFGRRGPSKYHRQEGSPCSSTPSRLHCAQPCECVNAGLGTYWQSYAKVRRISYGSWQASFSGNAQKILPEPPKNQ